MSDTYILSPKDTQIERVFDSSNGTIANALTDLVKQPTWTMVSTETPFDHDDIAYNLNEYFLRRRKPKPVWNAHIYGEWITGREEQPDIKEERGGALDEFLEEFKPQQTINERSDELSEC